MTRGRRPSDSGSTTGLVASEAPAPPGRVAESRDGDAGTEWSIELLRGVAALMVVLAHYRQLIGLPGGVLDLSYSGVDLFFVLSGFVFAPYCFGRRLQAAPYFIRRLLRIYPMYFVAVLAYAGLRVAAGQPVDTLGRHLLFLHTLQSRAIAFDLNPAFWSLPPEVEFYLALPLLAWGVQGGRALLVATAGALALHLAVALAMPVQVDQVNAATVASVHLPGVGVEFMLGMLAWRAARSPLSARARRLALVAGALGLLSVGAVFQVIGTAGLAALPWLRDNLSLLAAGCYAALVVAWVGAWRQPWGWVKAVALVAGNLSYGIYLFHNAAPRVLQLLPAAPGGAAAAGLSLLLTLSAAALLHRLLEAPARKLGRRVAHRLETAA